MKFLQPTTIAELSDCLLQKPGKDAHLVAGCTDFLTKRNGKAWDAELIISLTSLPQLREIRKENKILSIGACCTHTQVEESKEVSSFFPALSEACSDVGSKQIRNRGTIGGSIGNASPAGDIYPALLVLDAQAVILHSSGTVRRIPINRVVTGIGRTSLAEDEAIIAFELPLPPCENINAFTKLGERAHVTIAKINLAASLTLESGIIHDAKIALGAVSERAFLSPAGELLEGKTLDHNLLQLLYKALSDDIRRSIPTRASMPYKAQAVLGPVDDLLNRLIARKK